MSKHEDKNYWYDPESGRWVLQYKSAARGYRAWLATLPLSDTSITARFSTGTFGNVGHHDKKCESGLRGPSGSGEVFVGQRFGSWAMFMLMGFVPCVACQPLQYLSDEDWIILNALIEQAPTMYFSNKAVVKAARTGTLATTLSDKSVFPYPTYELNARSNYWLGLRSILDNDLPGRVYVQDPEVSGASMSSLREY